MASIRQDALTGRWVILASGRRGRPDEFADLRRRRPMAASTPEDCPFCPGNEAATPPEVLATGRGVGAPADSPGWRVRAFPNKYPALRPDSPDLGAGAGLLPEMAAVGGHEVVACGPRHEASLGDMAPELLAEVLTVVQRRVVALQRCHPTVRHVLVFGNHGPDAGATLVHPHLQIIAGPLVPTTVREKVECLARHRREHGTCLLCASLRQEEEDGARLVAANAHGVVWAPFASRYSHEMRLVPRRHAGSLAAAEPDELAALAALLGSCVARLEARVPHVSFNLVIHSAPLGEEAGFHWHLEILPRLSRQAGYEAGSGFAINSTPPETAAARLRSAAGTERNET
ncbi:galactose-1-phosphate uridylyltransferase [bacterium DOLJORAL78_65_58]|nr:MAG: galactose-1-phosphate uridylyltransferase [bacterium DOLZORAL124_64_63]PIE76560.1 MAG: galactose-1-phosphate uridylyltransferase [bacterium DOLJORAL78_65_58]